MHHHRTGVVLADHHVENGVHPIREERRRLHDADDQDALSIDPHRLSDDAAVAAEALHPELVRQHHHRWCRGAVVSVVEQSPEHGRQPHDLEVVAGDQADIDARRLALALHREDDPGIFGDPLERLRAVAEVQDFGDGEGDVLTPRSTDGVAQIDQPVALAVR
jgi:hypothetical protein